MPTSLRIMLILSLFNTGVDTPSGAKIMIISLVVLYKAFLKANSAASPAPIYHKTWKDEVEGYPASSYAKSLQVVIH
jgi:hypothetical protein